MKSTITRRSVLQALAGLSLLAGSRARAREASLIGRLITEARTLPRVSQRIAAISGALLGVPYQANTLIGGPDNQEVFVVRDDAFDCVTFCEVVLAAAQAWDLDEFESSLRRIRYEHGQVRWEERNHYFADWSRRAVENGICRPIALPASRIIEKKVNVGNLGPRRVALTVIPRTTLLPNRKRLAAGDIIGFVSQRPNLDFYHTGLIAFGADGKLMLRHASQSLGRIVDEPMDAFIARSAVQYVTLVRPAELVRWPVAPESYIAALR